WIAGGGLRTGQVLGATDRRGEAVIGNPIGMKNVLATVYRVLGIDPAITIPHHNGRPQGILDERPPLGALLCRLAALFADLQDPKKPRKNGSFLGVSFSFALKRTAQDSNLQPSVP